MKSLSTLIQLQKTFVDEQRVMLARMQEQLERIVSAIAQLEIEKAREQVWAQKNPESSVTYGEFLKRAVQRGRTLERDRLVAEASVEAARAKLSELFEEQKRYELAEAGRVAAEAADERKRETLELDEIGSVTHERNKR
jgi:hypothetical protein